MCALFRDDQLLGELGVPFSAEYIINSAPEEFLLLQKRFILTRQQLALCKDIRRRGKNKVRPFSLAIGPFWSSIHRMLIQSNLFGHPSFGISLFVVYRYRYCWGPFACLHSNLKLCQ
jgi:hypothetical protein